MTQREGGTRLTDAQTKVLRSLAFISGADGAIVMKWRRSAGYVAKGGAFAGIVSSLLDHGLVQSLDPSWYGRWIVTDLGRASLYNGQE